MQIARTIAASQRCRSSISGNRIPRDRDPEAKVRNEDPRHGRQLRARWLWWNALAKALPEVTSSHLSGVEHEQIGKRGPPPALRARPGPQRAPRRPVGATHDAGHEGWGARSRDHGCHRLPHLVRQPQRGRWCRSHERAQPLDSSSPATLDGERIVIKTRIVGFTGKVRTGSVLGSAGFCPDGTVRHDRGNLQIGFPAVNVFNCQAGTLRIGFGPGPDQIDQAVQTSDWRVLDGTGSFAGATGEGTMRVKFDDAAAAIGHEVFIGVVVVP